MPLFGPPDVAQLKAKRDVQGLIRALGYTADPNVRRAAAAALGELGDARAVDPLILALKNPAWEHDWHDTAAAADALARLGTPAVGPLIAALGWHSKVVRVSAAGALGAIGQPAIQPLVVLLGDADLETRETAGQILVEIGADAIDPLIEALHDEQTGKRQRAATVLGEICDRRAVEPLTLALADPMAGVRQAAAKSLGEIGDPSAAGALAAALRDADQGVHRTAALALAEMKDPRAVQPLLPELRTARWQPAVDALVKLGDPSVEPMLAMLAESKARGDETRLVDALRSEVAEALTRIGYPGEVAALVTQLFAGARVERSEAAEELIRLYQLGGLDARAKALILLARPTIEQAHQDGPAEGGGHSDQGIGAPFPI
jgi:HEAT repeat protein